jgi:hypothetical protein
VRFPAILARHRSSFSGMDPASTTQALVERGHAGGLSTDPRVVDRIVSQCGRETMIDPHRLCPAVRALARDDQVLGVARRYLEVEPRLHASYLVWSPPGDDGDGRPFHREVVDLRAVTLFVYLTEVGRESSPHQVILAGDGRIHTMMGQRGTAWFADQTVLHRVQGVPTRERGTLIITYTFSP